MKVRAVSATSCHLSSMVSAWPRPGISVNSVTPGFFCWRVYAAWERVCGTVWSFSPDTISIGPRSGLRVSTLSSVRGLKFAGAACQSGAPGGRDGERLEQAPGLVLVDGVGERVAELLVGQRDRAVPVVPIS